MSAGKSYTFTLTTGGTPLVRSALLVLSGALAASVVASLRRRLRYKPKQEGRSTTSSAGGGASAYETRKAVDEYVQFHYGRPDDLLPYPMGPKESLNFAARLAALCERHCAALQDFTGERTESTALDVGCAVGGASFELARSFQHVLGIDFSQHFVNAARTMKERGWMRYRSVEEGDITIERTASVAEDIDRERVQFMKGDACDLPADLPAFDAVLAANLLCRLPDPSKFLARLPSLVKQDGVLVLSSPYSWLEAWTPQEKWLGGYYDQGGKPVWSADELKGLMSQHFELVAEEEVPFIIREHARKFQWGCSHAMVWRRR